MGEHPYRAPAAKPGARRKTAAWTVALVVLWVASVLRALAVFFDHSLTGPITGLSIALAVGIPFIAVNARVLRDADSD